MRLRHRCEADMTSARKPLHHSSFKNHLDASKALVAHGANRDAVNVQGKRPLDLARSVQVKAVVAPATDDAEGYSGSGSDEDF